MTTLFLCRHGETEAARDEMYYWREHSPLTEIGSEQARNLAARLRRENLAAVFSGPLDRGIYSGDLIAAQHSLPLDIIPTLAEWNPGDWNGFTKTEIATQYADAFAVWSSDPSANRPPNGESWYDVAARAIPAVQEIVEAHLNDCIVIVGHNTLNRVVLAHFLSIALNESRRRIVQACGAINHLEFDRRDGWQINALNADLPKSAGTVDELVSTDHRLTPDSFLARLDLAHRQLEVIWPTGRNPCVDGDGQHWTLPPFTRPVSIGRIEAMFLYNLAVLHAPEIIVEVGTGFGYSTSWLAAGALASGAARPLVFSFDDHSEGGLAHEGPKFARKLSRDLGVARAIRLVHGHTPAVIDSVVSAPVNMGFIDGNHHGDQPYLDFKSIASLADPGAIIAWHDIEERYAVPAAFAKATAEGWEGKIFNTSCRLGVTYRRRDDLAVIERAFEAACASRLLVAGEK